MTNVVPLTNGKIARGPKIRIGLFGLTDAATVIAAHELGFFTNEGLAAELSVEPSWANIADKLSYGLLDAAAIVPPLAFAITLGLRGRAQRLIIPVSLSLGGNTVTLTNSLADCIARHAAPKRDAMAAVQALSKIIAAGECKRPMLGVVHAFSTHNLLLRYWLAAGGIDPERDVGFGVIPPARMVEALEAGDIAGFNAARSCDAPDESLGPAQQRA